MANYGNIKGTKGVDKINAYIDGGWVVPKENVDYAKTLMRLMAPDFDENATYTKTGKKISNANAKVSDGELVLNDKQVSILERNNFDPRKLSPNSPYNKYYEPKNVNFYGYTNLPKEEDNLFAMAFNYGGKVPSLKKQNNNLNDQAYNDGGPGWPFKKRYKKGPRMTKKQKKEAYDRQYPKPTNNAAIGFEDIDKLNFQMKRRSK